MATKKSPKRTKAEKSWYEMLDLMDPSGFNRGVYGCKWHAFQEQ